MSSSPADSTDAGPSGCLPRGAWQSLAAADQHALVAAAKCGDEEATDRIVQGHEPLIRKHAMHVAHCLDAATDFEDLQQAGRVGVLQALAKFDPRRGVKFTTFATYRIVGAIRDCAGQQPMKVTRAIREAASKVLEKHDELVKCLNRKPTVEQMAEGTGLTSQAVEEALCFLEFGILGLDELHAGGDEDDSPAGDEMLPDPSRGSRPSTTRVHVHDVLTRIHPPEAGEALLLYEGDGWSVRQIAEEFDVAEGTVKSWLARARMQFEELAGGDFDDKRTC